MQLNKDLEMITWCMSECPIFAILQELSSRTLPAYEDTMKYYQHVRIKICVTNEPSLRSISAVVVENRESLEKLASISHLS